jgi:hypothetical protein
MADVRTVCDLTIIKNRDYNRNLYLRDSDNVAIDITGWTGQAQIRVTDSPESDLIATITVTIADAALGKINLYIALADMTTCQATGYWDLVLTNAEGVRDSYVIGDVTFASLPTIVV